MFENLPEDTKHFIHITMSELGETVSTRGTVASEGVALEVASMEALTPVPMTFRSPRLKPTPVH